MDTKLYSRSPSTNVEDRQRDDQLLNFYRALEFNDIQPALHGFNTYNPIGIAQVGFERGVPEAASRLWNYLHPPTIDRSGMEPQADVRYSDPTLAAPIEGYPKNSLTRAGEWDRDINVANADLRTSSKDDTDAATYRQDTLRGETMRGEGETAQLKGSLGNDKLPPADLTRERGLTPEKQASINAVAQRLGIDPAALTTAIAYETGGEFSPSTPGKGPAAGRVGLIQFGTNERKQFNVKAGQSFDEQMQSVAAYLKARGVKPGMGLPEIYTAINYGNARKGANLGFKDASGKTIAQHLAAMERDYGELARRGAAGAGPAPKGGKTTSAFSAFNGALLGPTGRKQHYANDPSLVKDWQQKLADAGYYEGKIDGVYGKKTAAATMGLQASLGAKVDGVAGPQTRSLWETDGIRDVAAHTSGGTNMPAYTAQHQPDAQEVGTTDIASADFPPEESAGTRYARGEDVAPSGAPDNTRMANFDFSQTPDTPEALSAAIEKYANGGSQVAATPPFREGNEQILDPASEFAFAAGWPKQPEAPPPTSGGNVEGLATPTPSGVREAAQGTVPASGVDPATLAHAALEANPTGTDPGEPGFAVYPGQDPRVGSLGYNPDAAQPAVQENPDTSLGQLLSMSDMAGASPTAPIASTPSPQMASATPSTDIGSLLASATQANDASTALSGAPTTDVMSTTTPSTTVATPTTMPTATPGTVDPTGADIGRLLSTLLAGSAGASGDQLRASAYGN